MKRTKFKYRDRVWYQPTPDVEPVRAVVMGVDKCDKISPIGICLSGSFLEGEHKFCLPDKLKFDFTTVIIHYSLAGRAINDFEVSDYVDKIFNNRNPRAIHYVSSHLVIDEIRARIAEDKISHKDVVTYIEGRLAPLNEFGVFAHEDDRYGTGFTTFYQNLDLARRILTSGMKKRIADK